MEKLDHLQLLPADWGNPTILAYLLQETQLPKDTVFLGGPNGYHVLTVPCPSDTSHEGMEMLAHPTADVQWHHLGKPILAAKVGCEGMAVSLVNVYASLLFHTHRIRLEEARLPPSEDSTLTELAAVL